MMLFDPLELPRSGLRLKNRLVMAPMPTFGADADGSFGAAELAYYRRRAQGGVGATVTAGCAVSEDGIAHAGQWRCDADRFTDSLARCAQAIQSGGARAILQLEHAGGSTFLDEHEAPRLIRCFRDAARRAREAGFDGVALHGGHSELLQQYFSPLTNGRSWALGGPDAPDRSRFPAEVVGAVWEAFEGPCWYRLTPEEAEPDGITMEQTLELAEALVAAGVEVLDVAVKRYNAGSIRDTSDRRPRAAVLAAATSAAVMAVGGIATPADAEEAINDGCALVGLGHVLLGEPDWPRKVAAGEVAALDLSLSDHTKLEALDVPPPVIEYLRSRAAQRR